MVRNKIQCSYCGKMRAESDIFSGLCDTCAKKLQTGVITTEQIEARRELIKRLDYTPAKQPPTTTPADIIPDEDEQPEQPEQDTLTEQQQGDTGGAQSPTNPKEDTQPDPTDKEQIATRYYCDVCGTELKRGAYRCPKCQIVNDWRGTDLETDPDIVICDNCGAITDGKRCFNCGGGYE